MKQLVMIQYGELTTKKANRKVFVQKLRQQIELILKDYDVIITHNLIRMYIEVELKDLNDIVLKLKNVFGIHGIIIGYSVDTNINKISQKALELAQLKPYQTFKIETKRADKTFPIHSDEMNRKIAAVILQNTNLKVDVHAPDLLLKIEIRKDKTVLYSDTIKGLGGYPVGVQGKGLLMLSGGIDSPVAGYLALKRGVDLECVYFEAPPHTSEEAKHKVFTLTTILNAYSGHIKLHVVPFTKLQETIYKNVEPAYMITIMRRMMYRICEELAKQKKCKILINGESIGQVASQTLESMATINEVVKIPVIRPVACFDKLEIIDLAKKINTYETSILPYEDCCTVFVPKHPIIHPSLEKAKKMEETFDYKTLIQECLEQVETISIQPENKYNCLL